MPGQPRSRGGVHAHRPPARAPPTCACAGPMAPAARCSSAATWAATTGRSCRTRRPGSAADVLLVESTYGDRAAPGRGRGRRAGGDHQRDARERGGKVIIPAFAIGRVEEVLYAIKRLEDAGKVRAAAGLSRQPDGARGAEVLPAPCGRAGCRHRRAWPRGAARCPRSAQRVSHLSPRRRSRRRWSSGAGPAIVISSSGMATGGRVLHHLAKALPDRAEHRAVRRLPGRRHPRPAADRRCPGSADLRAVRSRARPRRETERDVGACRCERDRALAAHVSRRRPRSPTSSTASRRPRTR